MGANPRDGNDEPPRLDIGEAKFSYEPGRACPKCPKKRIDFKTWMKSQHDARYDEAALRTAVGELDHIPEEFSRLLRTRHQRSQPHEAVKRRRGLGTGRLDTRHVEDEPAVRLRMPSGDDQELRSPHHLPRALHMEAGRDDLAVGVEHP